ncbi:uncharacterized protein M6B38_307615 [Iris pallida]|uniref:FHA domain-containing protein n=1 Tax=Iris pallida TaxID=29817 RepID=A0AAX6GS42_IRIPA|nr:uncharacterized protein M6B38_348195 [Iris pallida]KAJ6841244.1 uncharacterized protein M6B38_307615 [Iris pallida]
MGGGGDSNDMEVGFAKLQGEDFEYYMQTYSIVLGRSSKHADVDVDLGCLGGGMNISRHHARIFYDFPRRRFALEVLGKNGCLVESVLYERGGPPVKLDSRDLLQMGDKKFYFLLPTRSIFDPRRPSLPRLRAPPPLMLQSPSSGTEDEEDDEEEDDDDEEEEVEEEEEEVPMGVYGRGKHVGLPAPAKMGKKPEPRSRADTNRESDNLQLLQLEEKDVVSCVGNVLSDICGPGEWMPMDKLHAELSELYGNIWHHSRIRKYLTSEDWPQNKTQGKPWFGLLTLLRKYPEHFVINTRSKGRVTSEFVSLVSLIS